MTAETKTSRRRVIGISAAAVAGVAAATAGIIGYTRRHRHMTEGGMPVEHERMPLEHSD